MSIIDPTNKFLDQVTRRHFLHNCKMGLGGMALASLLGKTPARNTQNKERDPLAPRPPHFAPRAKRVIYLHMAGSPPVLDMLDYKPELVKHHGKPCPDEFLKGRRFAFTSGVPTLLGSPRKWKQHGENGMWMSDALPSLSQISDKLTFVRSMWTDQFNHAPAQLLIYTGSPRQGRPSMGSWVTYGLGAENRDLPGFVVMISSGTSPSAGQNAWGSGFLPSVYQGVQCRSKGDPVLYVSNPPGLDRPMRRLSLDALRDLNEMQGDDPETRTRIEQYELAFRMQTSVPGVMDIKREPQSILDLYGAKPGASSFANNCLLARRLVEQGVRFVQLFDWGWDFHGTNASEGLQGGLTNKCRGMDKAVAALINDLDSRGLLEDTLVVWGGEFGRTPFREGRTAKSKVLGRDHYPDCYTMMMAGGGLKPGLIYGSTDELGFSVAENPVHVHDLQATLLHLLGMDHERLIHRFQGRDYRLTDVHGKVVHDLLA
ncbi:MAG: DUF1501 domain-containing protein [Planctomycetota bacterium]|nr:DUF1501 domain-containing protein [Planctomycetota bacterium]